MKLNPMLMADFYKISHRLMYPPNTTHVFSTWTPRTTRIKEIQSVVVAGHQAFVQEYLVDFFNENFFQQPKAQIVADYKRTVSHTLGISNPDTSHIEELHDLGFLPLLIKGLPEGTVVPLRTPTLTIQNTHPKFFWLTNYIETLMSCQLWPIYTSATISHEYKKILNEAAMRTVGNTEFVPFQGHDFSMRGMSGLHSSINSGLGHLLSFVGTDTIPAITAAEHYYDANVEKELVGTSVPATEHSIQCAYGDDLAYLDNMLSKVHPSGIVSIVSDGYDFWDVIGRVIPALKEKILARNGGTVGDKVVIRPDSGDPVLIVCGDPDGATELERKGAVEALWDIFGGTTTATGHKLLDSHIGLIYGDAITLERARQITNRLAEKGFASVNVVFGIGSFTYQFNTRDTFGFALKSTLCIVDGQERQIYKNPKTDDGVKKSQRGKVHVFYNDEGQITFSDGHSLTSNREDDLLRPIFKDGSLLNRESFATVRTRLNKS